MSMFKINRNSVKVFFKFRSTSALIFLAISGWILMLSISNNWTKDRIQYDVLEYYSYLPATFIHLPQQGRLKTILING